MGVTYRKIKYKNQSIEIYAMMTFIHNKSNALKQQNNFKLNDKNPNMKSILQCTTVVIKVAVLDKLTYIQTDKQTKRQTDGRTDGRTKVDISRVKFKL